MKIVYHHRTRSTDAQRIHILEIARAFETLGHEVEIVSLVPTDTAQHDAARDAGDAWWRKLTRYIPFTYELVQLGYNVVGIPMLWKSIRRLRPDFIYERYSLFNLTGVVVARLVGIPIVLEVNSPFALEQSRDRDIRLTGFARWMERTICNMATRVVVVSTPLARMMTGAGVDASRIDVMPNGVNLDHFQPSPASAQLREQLGLNDVTVIGFVGWFRKWHGLETLLDAFRMSGLCGQAKVLLIGDGQAMRDLKAFVAANDLENDVVFTGPLPHAEVPPYIDLIDIAVQPAANEYCCPMKLLEYMALGKAIVAPRQENITEILVEEEEAKFFTKEDASSLARALCSLVRDKARAVRMGSNAKAAVTNRGYLWTANAQRVIDALRRNARHRVARASSAAQQT